ncbi:MAG: type II secretion system minor pseudopilin GspJ [Pseudomonadota bacterium]|nr:type II secretion system minor pseudopilin GspJ [Pseudomonadota bacterium]
MILNRPTAAGEAGFTLVEMLVAMTIFAILAAVGVSILRISVDTQAAVDRRLTEIGELGRLQASLAMDLGQAVDRRTRDGQASRPAFVGEPGRIAFVRSGWTNLDDEPRSTLQRVEWRIADGGLARIGHRRIDGGGESGGVPAVFAREAAASFRFREANGNWSTTYLSTEERPLPAAVEVVVKPRAASAVTMVIALPAIENRPAPAPQVPGPPLPPGQLPPPGSPPTESPA